MTEPVVEKSATPDRSAVTAQNDETASPKSQFSLRMLFPFAVFVLILLMAIMVIGQRKDGEDPNELPSMLAGKSMPAFRLPVLGDETRFVTDQDLKGKPYLLNVWATWCPTCYVEHPYLLELAQQGRIRLIGMNYKDEREKALQYLVRMGNPYETVVADNEGRLAIDLGVYGAPETFLVSAQGVILYRRAGDVNERVWQDEIVPLLAQAGVQP